MIDKHTTSTGSEMLISQMDDNHLGNAIRLIIKNIEKLKASLGASIEVSPFNAALYGIDVKRVSETSKEMIPSMVRSLYPYLAEASLRGMYFSRELQACFDRTGAEARFIPQDNNPVLMEAEYNIDDGWEDVGRP